LGAIWETWWHLLLNILVAINSVVHNPGIAIILFTLLIKVLTVPLTMKSLRSSRNMQAIQPLVKEVQKKYAKDRAKQQEETMKIYQQYGVNPAAGCFPILVTIPIFLGLYSALQFTLQHGTNAEMLAPVLFNDGWVPFANFSQPFLWVPNLAVADPLYIWPFLSGIFQFFQSRMAMPMRDPNQPMDPQMKMMNSMMQFMPIYIVLISLGFPAGTVIYWAMSNVFSAVQQYFITGWGSLPNFPGFGFLPSKPYTPPPPPEPSLALTEGKPKRSGVMGWMMDKALEAQEAQKAAQAGQSGQAPAITAERQSDGATTIRVKGKGKGAEHVTKVVPTSTVKYASDLKKQRPNGQANGLEDEEFTPAAPTSLPRKRRSKK
jgi:YidC/Oxa1 family membrane protein insertase